MARLRDWPGRRTAATWMSRHPTPLIYHDRTGLLRRTNLANTLEAYWFVGWNFGLPDCVLRRIPTGSTVIDAGANIGIVTGQMCQAVGRGGRVIAVEPLPANVQRLRELKQDNDLPQLQLADAAVADRNSTAQLKLYEDGASGYGSFTASWNTAGTISVQTRTIDSLALESQRVAFIKLDVEGAEGLAIKGAERVLADDAPLIYCEFNDVLLKDAGSSSIELAEQLASLGYQPVAEDQPLLEKLDGGLIDILLESRGRPTSPEGRGGAAPTAPQAAPASDAKR